MGAFPFLDFFSTEDLTWLRTIFQLPCWKFDFCAVNFLNYAYRKAQLPLLWPNPTWENR